MDRLGERASVNHECPFHQCLPCVDCGEKSYSTRRVLRGSFDRSHRRCGSAWCRRLRRTWTVSSSCPRQIHAIDTFSVPSRFPTRLHSCRRREPSTLTLARPPPRPGPAASDRSIDRPSSRSSRTTPQVTQLVTVWLAWLPCVFRGSCCRTHRRTCRETGGETRTRSSPSPRNSWPGPSTTVPPRSS